MLEVLSLFGARVIVLPVHRKCFPSLTFYSFPAKAKYTAYVPRIDWKGCIP